MYDDGGLFAGRYNGTYDGATFDQLPSINFAGAKAGVAWKNLSPRVGFTYDLTGDGRNVVKFNYGRYVGQMGTGTLSSVYNPVGATYVRFPWVDLNGDKVIQANEVVLLTSKGIAPVAASGGYNYNNPTQLTTTGRVDPNITADNTDEILVSYDRQFGRDFAVSGAYIYRKYTNFRWSPLDDFSSADYKPVTWTPPASSCPAGATCPTVTYYERTRQPGTAYTYTNQPDYWREFRGFEVTARKRMSNGWLMNASFSYNDAPVHYDSPAAYQDPTNVDKENGGQYAPESTSSGLGNVFVNARWLFRLSGVYQLPWYHINVSGFLNTRDGYPIIRTVTGPSRPYGQSAALINIDRIGDVRLPTFKTVDFRVDKVFTFINRVQVTASMDVFNLLNGNTALSIRGRQNASNANTISSLLAPRVIRFGFRATF